MTDTLPPFPVENDIHPELRQFLNDTRADLRDLKTAVIGNKEYKQIGLIDRQDATEAKVAEIDRKVFKASVILTATGTVLVFMKDFVVGWFSSPKH